jgi:histidinol-phosphate aminotransferase
VARPNVAVLRTFSKAHAMAGLRVGYLMAPQEVATAVRTVCPPFPVSTPAVAAALSSLRHPEWLTERVRAAKVERRRLTEALGGVGITVPPSQANFVWLPLGDRATAFADHAADHGLLVRPFPGEGVRITVGDPRLPEVLEPVLAEWAG